MALAVAAGLTGPGSPGPVGPLRLRGLSSSALPSEFQLTFASRSGSSSGAIVLGCSAGPWRFIVPVVGLFGAGHQEGRRMRIRRDIPNGYGVEARESFRIRAPKAAVLRSKSLRDSVRWCRFAW